MSTKNSSILTKKYRLVLSAVHMVYRLVNATFNVKELILRLTRLVCQLIHADAAYVYILDPAKKKIVLIAAFNNRINMVIEEKEKIAQVSESEKAVAFGASIYKRRLIGIPLVGDDNIGAIFISRKNQQKPFTDFDREVLSVIAEQAVTAIKNLQLYEGQQKIILDSIKSMGKLLEKQGYGASANTSVYSAILKNIAEKLSMSHLEIECLQYAGLLHHAGAIDVPYEILSKRSRLTSEEFKIIRNLPTKSVELIKPVEFLKPVLPIILYHREKYDGTGYPAGLKREQIPLGARVMAVVDAFEAMTRGRPYKKALSIKSALNELKENSGTQFDPKVVDFFCILSKQKKFRKYLSLMKK